MAAYINTIQYGSFRQQLAARNQDASNIYWSDAELKLLTLEALRTWQAMTGSNRVRASIASSQGTAFYDLTSNTGTSGVYGYKVTDQQILSALEYHLMEPQSNTSIGVMFGFSNVVQAMQNRRDMFLYVTGAVLTRQVTPSPASPIGRVPLPQPTTAVRRAAWLTPDGLNYSPLWPDDAWAATAFLPSWNANPGNPLSYSVIEDATLELQLIPPPIQDGSLDLITVQSGVALNPSVGVLLGIPDNWSWIVKWGTLADLLAQDGEATDANRAQYCEQRFQEALDFARQSAVVLQVQLNGLATEPVTLADLDVFMPSWQLTAGPPTAIAIAGMNLIALGPVPDAFGPYSATFDLVQNFPVPVLDNEWLQVSNDVIDVLLDYAQHLSLFKEGWASVNDSLYLYQRFQQHASVYNQQIMAASRFLPAIRSMSTKEETERPYREVPV